MRYLRFQLALIAASLTFFTSVAAGQEPASEPVQASVNSPARAGVDPEIASMQHIEDGWSAALVKHDQYALELVLAPSYVDISAAGDVSTRNQQITRLLLKENAPISLEQKVASVRMFGDLAVVNGTYILRKHDSGQTVDEKGIFSHIFQRVRSNWQCINSQRTIVVEQPLQAPGKKKQARSNAEQPFHIPLLHPGAKSDQPQQNSSDSIPLPH